MATNPLQQAANAMAEAWFAEFLVKPKQESASQICNDFKVGLITGRQALQLLMQLGYNSATAQRILSICYLRKLPKTLQTMPAPGTKDYQKMQDALES